LEYFRKNYKKSLKLLTSCRRKDAEHDDESIFHNNLGCIYFKLQRFNAASLFFQKAVNMGECWRNVQSLHHSYAPDIAYNNGLSLLSADQFIDAFKSFLGCSEEFSDRPHLWIRMAECCIGQACVQKGKEDKRITFQTISTGHSRRIAIWRWLFDDLF
jgi:CCR4-NOT transcription complex subunit 10